MRARVRGGLLPACLAAIVLGILGLHAFGHQATMGDHTAATRTGTAHELPVIGSATTSSTATSEDGPVTASVSGAEHSMGDMVMLCAAMLVGAAAGLVLAWRLRRAAATRPLEPRLRHLVTRAGGQRSSTGPPYVWKFSVLRC